MTVTIKLKPEIEKRLAEKAKENGLQIETYLEVFIENNLKDEMKKNPSETATSDEWIAKLKNWSESHNRTTPLLTDEATRRENIY